MWMTSSQRYGHTRSLILLKLSISTISGTQAASRCPLASVDRCLSRSSKVFLLYKPVRSRWRPRFPSSSRMSGILPQLDKRPGNRLQGRRFLSPIPAPWAGKGGVMGTAMSSFAFGPAIPLWLAAAAGAGIAGQGLQWDPHGGPIRPAPFGPSGRRGRFEGSTGEKLSKIRQRSLWPENIRPKIFQFKHNSSTPLQHISDTGRGTFCGRSSGEGNFPLLSRNPTWEEK